ncbi:carbohydrate ABC transporter, N-acetylglucosamine/diacetylchitobiose-binding protein [Actinoplanes cyaneus]|uniref:Carbohydrate ABC transporter, N-acetylglucosamine/diacetylchitobiose-binding protein n=1 Tax=Actinoplanes cyaneus TaxID=52696 RepID=A0A919IIX8_9ACTN|nr:N-acetylglucosamine/diacetylchitobiose ABC transporter substrate-binding protein [Actinoplanes cyaneus]MCW2142499.1 N-acetylglucosamine transport system substrate-binding protein [Actinoplanes cyaneus]GID65306.1 carbohydrate ABC transporter, N-acetylglucosamine/diacetylchitobiose-binding protein [Actinoplanes cyaneus]
MDRLSRRGLLQGAAGVAAAGALGGCAMGGDDATNGDAKGTTSANNPLGVKEDAPLEVVIFNGGFGEEYAKAHEALYRGRYPKAEIKHSATQQIAETLQPRFVAGDPPDVIDNSGGSQIDFNGLVSQGALTDLGELLDAPSLDDPGKKVRDTLLPGIVDVGSYDGKFLTVNYAYSAYGIWYSKKLFDAKGWEYPTTWDGMIALCRTIKAAGIAPWTYTGVHARYMSWPILTAAAKLGGIEVIKAIDNLEPNAWKHDAVRTAADAYYQLAVDGFLQPGAEGMDHIQSQTEWCRGHAAFISCGSWLENEQKSVTPPGFDMAVAPTPSLGTSDKLPFGAFRGTGSEPFIVPAKGKNVRGGMEYLRIMLSKKAAADFTTRVSSLTAVTGAADGLSLGPGLTSVTKLIDASQGSAFTWLYSTYYRKLERERVNAASLELFTKRITASQWCDRVQKSADEFAKDPAIKKYKRA